MRERHATFAVVGTAGGVLGLCCGLPLLASLGVVSAVAGLSVSSWALIGLGLVLAALGWARWVRDRRRTSPHGAARAAQNTAPDLGVGTVNGHPL